MPRLPSAEFVVYFVAIRFEFPEKSLNTCLFLVDSSLPGLFTCLFTNKFIYLLFKLT